MNIKLSKYRFQSIPEKPQFEAGFQTKYFAEDPTMMVFSVFVEFTSPLLCPPDGMGESAERFFRSLGDDARAEKCVEFRNRLFHLMNDTPYLMKSIDGLSNIYNYEADNIYEVREIEVQTYETLDLRIAKLAELYTDLVWDFENQKRILPDNLEWINYHIVVNDIRELALFVKGSNGDMLLNDVTAYLDSFIISFRHAKFSFRESNSFLSSISNEEPTNVNNSFKFIGGKMSKKKNRILLTNDQKNETIYDNQIEGTRAVQDSILGSGEKSLKKLAIDYLREEATQVISEKILDPAKNSLFNLLNQNSLFGRTDEFDLSRLVTGDQNIEDIMPKWGNIDQKLQKAILDKEKLGMDKAEDPNVSRNTVNVSGMTDAEIINAILNDVNRRLPYSNS